MPLLARTYRLNFTGGEPLLSFGLLRRIVALAEAENAARGLRSRYSLTTNGSLLSPAVLRFLSRFRFTVTLSYDGTAQDEQRQRGSSRAVLSRLASLLRDSRLRLMVNSVFSPLTVGRLSETARLLFGLSVPEFRFSPSVLEPWSNSALRGLERELRMCESLALDHFSRTGRLPLANFREERQPGVFRCAAGRDRLALAPGGRLWGCHLLGDYFRKAGRPARAGAGWSAGLADLRGNPAGILSGLRAQHARLSMDRFSTPEGDCFLCPDLQRCAVCPVTAALAGPPLGRIPLQVCRIQKIFLESRDRFLASLRRAKPAASTADAR